MTDWPPISVPNTERWTDWPPDPLRSGSSSGHHRATGVGRPGGCLSTDLKDPLPWESSRGVGGYSSRASSQAIVRF